MFKKIPCASTKTWHGQINSKYFKNTLKIGKNKIKIKISVRWKGSEWKCLSCVWLLRPHLLYSPWNSPGQNTGVGSCSLLQGIFPFQGSNPSLPHWRWILYQLSHQGSPRILEWVAYSFSSRSSWPRNGTALQTDSLPTELWGKPKFGHILWNNF